jgi:hypothetical protein
MGLMERYFLGENVRETVQKVVANRFKSTSVAELEKWPMGVRPQEFRNIKICAQVINLKRKKAPAEYHARSRQDGTGEIKKTFKVDKDDRIVLLRYNSFLYSCKFESCTVPSLRCFK